MSNDLDVRERGGLVGVKHDFTNTGDTATVTLSDRHAWLEISVIGKPYLTSTEARSLARQLGRMARRIDERLDRPE